MLSSIDIRNCTSSLDSIYSKLNEKIPVTAKLLLIFYME
jgi:hypothetical protein